MELKHILSEDSEEDEEYEDEEDEESELDEEDLFISKSREIRNSRRQNKSASNDDVMFDIHDDEEEEIGGKSMLYKKENYETYFGIVKTLQRHIDKMHRITHSKLRSLLSCYQVLVS